ncbi:PQQ-binding-like beta-propeller repeat protein [Alkalihalobacillus sp. FSL W8-0930]
MVHKKTMVNMSLATPFLLILFLFACSSEESTSEPLETAQAEIEKNEEVVEETTEEVIEEEENEGYPFPPKAEIVSSFSEAEIKTSDDYDNLVAQTLRQDNMTPRIFLGDEEVVAAESFFIYRYDLSNQEEIWRMQDGIHDLAEAQIIDGTLYSYNTKGVIATDLDSGKVVRDYPFELGHEPRPHYFDDYLLLYNHEELTAFDFHTGEELWTNSLPSAIDTAIIESDQGFIYENDLILYILDKDTGEVLFEHDRPYTLSDSKSLNHYPIVHEDSIFVADYALVDRVTILKELDAKTGELRNEASFDASHSGMREPMKTDTGILMPTDIEQSGELAFLNFDLEEQWRIDHDGFVLERYLYLDGKIYLVAAKGEIPAVGDYHLFVIDSESGEIEEAIELGNGFKNKQLYTNNGKVYVYLNGDADTRTFIYDHEGNTYRPFAE